MSKNVKRLFRQFQPDNYTLSIKPDAQKMVFEGNITIEGKKTGPPSQRLSLHQKDLEITDVEVENQTKSGTKKIDIDRINTHGSLDELRLHSKSMIYPGKYTIRLKFSGQITKDMHGIYPCPFKHMGKDKVLLATQLESHYAREVFPCIDEPEAKATFDLTLITPNKQKVLANTPIKKQAGSRESKGWIETMFQTTPRMSAYLLAFAVGEIHSVSAKSKSGVTVSSWATVAQPTAFLEYANSEAVKILDFFADYFKTPFPLPKLDQIALPDFEMGAMENWGLITFREVLLLADPDNRSASGEQRISEVIAHELSHQWFGNLVTMKWWDDLWLNESFASMMEYLALDKLHPGWKIWESFISADAIAASNKDIYKDVQSVGVKVNHPDEIHTLFDGAIVYAKGGRLLKMLLDYIGEDAFREGLRRYFAKHAYKNTIRSDLWSELSSASQKNVGQIMTPWLEKSGMPVISVSVSGKHLVLSQERFLLDGQDKQSLWPVPLLADKELGIDLLETHKQKLSISEAALPAFNVSGSGHYIVNYKDTEAKENLKQKIINQEIDSSGRINAMNDMLLLNRKSEYPMTDILDLARKCGKEPRDSSWSMISRALGLAAMLIEGDEECEGQIRKIKRELSDYWFNLLGWDDSPDDNPNTKLLRTTILSLRIGGEDKEALDKAMHKFQQVGKVVEKLPAEHRAIIAGAAVRFGDKTNVEELLEQYSSNPNPDVQHSITAALCSTKDRQVGKKLIDWALAGNGSVRDQDVLRWFAYLTRNRHTREDTWAWLIKDWSRISKIFEKTLDDFVSYSASAITTSEAKKRFSSFFEPKKNIVLLHRTILVSVSAADARVTWRQHEEPIVKRYLLNK